MSLTSPDASLVAVAEVGASIVPVGPIAVHSFCDSGLFELVVKMRKLAVAWSATGSPRPVPSWVSSNDSDQLLSVPESVDDESLITSVQVPAEFLPLSALSSDCNGLKMPLNGAVPCWIDVPAVSSNTVSLKLARVPLLPTPADSRM